MRPFLQRLAKVAECFVHVYSNAGLPNAMGGYDDKPEDLARAKRLFAEEGLINMLGGCCGCTPAHMKASVYSSEFWFCSFVNLYMYAFQLCRLGGNVA